LVFWGSSLSLPNRIAGNSQVLRLDFCDIFVEVKAMELSCLWLYFFSRSRISSSSTSCFGGSDEVKAFAQNMTTSIPLYNFPVEAGTPFLAEDDSCEMYPLREFNIPNPQYCFMAKVSGYSMKDAGILPNDLLLVDRKKETV
jgi:SOS-response transcriptional repressor LexA